MYLNHYNLKTRPFGISPDSSFLWLSEKHTEALATLRYGIMNNKGFLLVTGDVGTGKTILINRLIDELKIKVILASIPDPELDALDFFKILAVEFNMNAEFRSKGEFLIHFRNFLQKAYTKKFQVLLIIDEAQRLSHELLEQIRLLSNIELDDRKLINIFFVGQPEFNDILMEERNRAVRQRIALRYNIDPLTQNETYQYIKHRLRIGGTTNGIFTPDAVDEIFSSTKGYPRLINIICDHALLSGYVSGIHEINRKVIKECAKEIIASTPFGIHAAHGEKQKEAVTAGEDLAVFAEPQKSAGSRRIGQIVSLITVAIVITLCAFFLYHLVRGSDYARLVNETTPRERTGLLPKKHPESAGVNDESNPQSMAPPSTSSQLSDRHYRNQIQQPIPKAIETETPDNYLQEKKIIPPENTPDPGNSEITEPATGFADAPSLGEKIIVYFSNNSNRLSFPEKEKLDEFVKLFSFSPKLRIIIEGFTDAQGYYHYEKHLSKFRAGVVKDYLVAAGISPSTIEVLGRGSDNPLAKDYTFEGRRRNRRVEVRVE